MGVIRGRGYRDRKIVQTSVTHGEPIFEKCECGKWRNIKTGEHAESYNLSEFMKLFPKKSCIDKKSGGGGG